MDDSLIERFYISVIFHRHFLLKITVLDYLVFTHILHTSEKIMEISITWFIIFDRRWPEVNSAGYFTLSAPGATLLLQNNTKGVWPLVSSAVCGRRGKCHSSLSGIISTVIDMEGLLTSPLFLWWQWWLGRCHANLFRVTWSYGI